MSGVGPLSCAAFAVLATLWVLFVRLLARYLTVRLSYRAQEIALDQEGYQKLLGRQQELQQTNSLLEKQVEDIVAIYTLTKDICAALDEEKVFALFKSSITRYLRLRDCLHLPAEAKVSVYAQELVFPLKIERHTVGYVVGIGVEPQDRERFYILVHQFMLGMKRAYLYQRIQELAITDTMTKTFNRRYLLSRFHEEFERARAHDHPLALVMVDVDNFKEYNDRYGHLVGDAVLAEVGRVIKEGLRQIDLVGRYGGEEFAILLTETDREGARLAAERIRLALSQRVVRAYDEELTATMSMGIAVALKDASTPAELIERADKALYRAKQSGKNRVCVYDG